MLRWPTLVRPPNGDEMNDTPWSDWVGRTLRAEDVVAETPARALAATLNRPDAAAMTAGAELPGPWVWLYFLELAPTAEIASDGHPKRGGFLPPVALPRRMWAGSRCAFHAPIRIGEKVERVSTILSVSDKTGKAGPMTFVTVRHEIFRAGEMAMEEEQDIVYLDIADHVAAPAGPPPERDWGERVAVDPVLLFRFSALTFNAHRIHYDRAYAVNAERYPGLVVHGPLQAILLFDAACRHAPGRRTARFSFRGVRPMFDSGPLALNGRADGPDAAELYTADAEGAVGMKARLEWRLS